MRMLPLIRPLPLAIAAMTVLLGVKGIGLVTGGHGDGGRSALALAGAAVVPSALAASPPAPAAPKPPAQPPVPVQPQVPAEPAVSDAERAVLQDLRARRTALDAREQATAAREAVLAATEKRLGARVDELAALQARLESLEGARRERDEANWRGLVRTYEAMRPRDAATIMNELEMPVLLQVLDRMKDAKAAPVLAAMTPDRARAATAQLAQMRTRANTPAAADAAPASLPGR